MLLLLRFSFLYVGEPMTRLWGPCGAAARRSHILKTRESISSDMRLLSIFGAIAATSALATETPGTYQLKYFDIRGVAEISRVLFALGQEPYNDARYDIDASFNAPGFQEDKQSGNLKMNLNRAPVLVTPEGRTIGQSKSIERYLARRFGLMGSSPEDEATIDCIAEHCRDVKDAAQRKGFSRFARDKTDEEKAAARAEWFETDLPDWLRRIEAVVMETSSTPGYAVGSSPSYADVIIWSLLRDCAADDLGETTKAAASCELLNSIAEEIAANPNVKRWLESRPETKF